MLLKQVTDIKNRLIGAARTTKGVMRMTKVIAGVGVTLYNIGCGLAGGILSQTRLHSARAQVFGALRVRADDCDPHVSPPATRWRWRSSTPQFSQLMFRLKDQVAAIYNARRCGC
jgi:hypothetical protein